MLAAFAAFASAQYDLLLKGGHVVDPRNSIDAPRDVAIKDGRIAAVSENIPPDRARQTLDVSGLYVTPGLIDLHVHVFYTAGNPNAVAGESSIQPDAHSFRSGVTTMVDAGSSGWKNFEIFRTTVIDRAQTRVLALINISGFGMISDMTEQGDFNAKEVAHLAQKHKDVVVGVKSAHYQLPGWESVDEAVAAGAAADIPVMVDFGYMNNIRSLPTLLLDKLRAGDIYTHCYSGHREEILPDGKINPAMFTGRKRGIFFDVGFGAGSFYWYVAVPALQQNFPPDSISTDLHTGSMNAGMKSMTNAMSSILILGSTLDQVVAMSTWNPAKQIKRTDLGNLDVGAEADIAVLRVDKGKFGFIDSAGAMNTGNQRIVTELTVRNGRVVWDLNGRASENWKSFKYDRKKWVK
jgi:dihydroorotase